MKREIDGNITKAALDAIDTLAELSSYQDLMTWAQVNLKRVIAHEGLECGTGSISASGLWIKHIKYFDIPVSYFSTLAEHGQACAPFITTWMNERQPQLVQAPSVGTECERWASVLHRLELDNLAFHAVMSPNYMLTFFSFYRLLRPFSDANRYLIHLITPHLHVAAMRFSKLQTCSGSSDESQVTQREREILGWLQFGKTNWEIGRLLNISDKTVKNHIQKIFFKLDVHNRVQLVAKAMDLKIIERRTHHRPFGL